MRREGVCCKQKVSCGDIPRGSQGGEEGVDIHGRQRGLVALYGWARDFTKNGKCLGVVLLESKGGLRGIKKDFDARGEHRGGEEGGRSKVTILGSMGKGRRDHDDTS